MGIFNDKYWGPVGKIGVLISMILGLIAIISTCNTDYKLNAKGTKFNWEIPDTVFTLLSYGENIRFEDKYFEHLTSDYPNIDSTATDLIKNMIKKSYKDINNIFKPRGAIMPLDEFLQINLENAGKKELNNLVLNIPGIGYYQYKMPEGRFAKFESKIELGSLRPSDKIVLVCWRSKFLTSVRYEDQEIKVTFPEGSVRVSFSSNVTGIGKWIYYNTAFTIFILLIALVLIFYAGALAEYYLDVWRPKSAVIKEDSEKKMEQTPSINNEK